MNDVNLYMTMAGSGLAGLGMVVAAGLTAWRDYLGFRRRELEARDGPEPDRAPVVNAGARIEIADLRERIRKLEAIAAGVDL